MPLYPIVLSAALIIGSSSPKSPPLVVISAATMTWPSGGDRLGVVGGDEVSPEHHPAGPVGLIGLVCAALGRQSSISRRRQVSRRSARSRRTGSGSAARSRSS